MSTSRHTHFFELLEAMGQPGCPICRRVTNSVVEYFGSLGYEQVNDVDLRAELRAGGGFCPRHAWLFYAAGGNRLGLAIVYRDLLDAALGGLRSGGSVAGGFGRRIAGFLGRSGAGDASSRSRDETCTACRTEVDAEARYRSTLVEHLGEADVRERYNASAGLCLPHLSRALDSPGRVDDLRWLRQDATNRLRGLVAELDEYIRKHDYRFRGEGFGDERDAPKRAVGHAVGQKSD